MLAIRILTSGLNIRSPFKNICSRHEWMCSKSDSTFGVRRLSTHAFASVVLYPALAIVLLLFCDWDVNIKMYSYIDDIRSYRRWRCTYSACSNFVICFFVAFCAFERATGVESIFITISLLSFERRRHTVCGNIYTTHNRLHVTFVVKMLGKRSKLRRIFYSQRNNGDLWLKLITIQCYVLEMKWLHLLELSLKTQ